MVSLALYSENISFGDALFIALISILIVFAVLIVIIIITTLFSKGINKVESLTEIKPRPENKLLDEDEDAVVAALVATIEFNKETGKNAHLVSISRIDEE